MAVLKVYCSRCGQRVSGDESFLGTSVQCPVCSAEIQFPESPGSQDGGGSSPADPASPAQGGEGPPESLPTPLPQPEHVVPPPPRATDPSISSLPTAGPPPSGGLPAAASLPSGPALPQGPVPGSVPPPASSPALPAQTESAGGTVEKPSEDEDAGVMPVIVLATGILSFLSCSGCLVVGAVSIIAGHLTLIKMNHAGIKDGRNKVAIGMILGYSSVLLFLVFTVAWKLGLESLVEEMLQERGASGGG